MNLPHRWRGYWNRQLKEPAISVLIEKYRELLDLAEMVPGDPRNRRVKNIVGRWPGSLREAELIGIEVCRARLEGLLAAPSGPRSYSHWRSIGFACLPLWNDLHAMLSEQLEWKRVRDPNQRDLSDFCHYLNHRHGSCDRLWPDEDVLSFWAGSRVGPRQAYLWLAAWAQLPLAELNFHLLAREGPWDHRESDPRWTKEETGVP